MPAIHIRDLSRGTLERLKARARRNDRSLQAELKSILDGSSQKSPRHRPSAFWRRTISSWLLISSIPRPAMPPKSLQRALFRTRAG
jgi:hypothetical protein